MIKIETSNPLRTGVHTIDLLVTEDFSGLTHITSFEVLVTCVRTISQATNTNDVIYFITDPQASSVLPKFNLVPALCPNELVYNI